MMPHPERAVSAALGSADGRGVFASVRAAALSSPAPAPAALAGR
jgi:hypothetical protein